MHIAYYDEAGDDGFPSYSSSLFVLTSLYLHYTQWRATYEAIWDFRKQINTAFGLPVKIEFHARQFLLGKDPYRQFKIPEDKRGDVISLFCDRVAGLEVKIINVAIVKPRIQLATYSVLDRALTYSVQRIENDLKPDEDPANRFLIITDAGRVGKMRNTTRRIQRINFIPSKFGPTPYRKEIQALIEDPLPKDSKESYFIQCADLISYVVYLYALIETSTGALPKRLPSNVDYKRVCDWMNRLKPALNLKASNHPFGIVYHPKN